MSALLSLSLSTKRASVLVAVIIGTRGLALVFAVFRADDARLALLTDELKFLESAVSDSMGVNNAQTAIKASILLIIDLCVLLSFQTVLENLLRVGT